MRRRHALKVVKELDAFPKVAEDYVKPTTRGGLFSVVAVSAIFLLTLSEIFYYRASDITFEYSVDTDMDSKLKLRFDITVAMPCQYIGADVVDAAGNSKSLVQEVHKEATIFELNQEQREWLLAKQRIISRHERKRSLKDLLIDTDGGRHRPFPSHQFSGGEHLDSCRVHGHFEVNKVAGNFHITAGQAIQHPQGHAHLNAFVPPHLVNFSHRIDLFGFGSGSSSSIIDPLEGTHILAKDNNHLFQYFLQIVPTTLQMGGAIDKTNQYSVTERNRTIDHASGSHGLPGLFFKYEIYSMMVLIREEHKSVALFLVRLCSISGGVFVTLGMISQFLGYIISIFKSQQANNANES